LLKHRVSIRILGSRHTERQICVLGDGMIVRLFARQLKLEKASSFGG